MRARRLRRFMSTAVECERAVRDEERRKCVRPEITEDDVKAHLQEFYPALRVGQAPRLLNSYDDQNFLVVAEEGKYVFKVHNGVESDDVAFLTGQTKLYRHLRQQGITAPFPCDSPEGGEASVTWVRCGEQRHAVRVLEWVNGKMLSDSELTPAKAHAAGVFLARMHRAMEGFDHPGLHRPHVWDLRRTPVLRHFMGPLALRDDGGEGEALVNELLQRFEESDATLAELPQTILQGDFNDANIVVNPQGEVSGVIDFGDCMKSWRVNDLAVACAYLCISLAQPEGQRSGFPEGAPLAAAAAMVAGASALQLSAAEREALPLLCACRLAGSATMGAYTYQRSLEENPDMPKSQRDYLLFHASPAWTALRGTMAAIRDGTAASLLL